MNDNKRQSYSTIRPNYNKLGQTIAYGPNSSKRNTKPAPIRLRQRLIRKTVSLVIVALLLVIGSTYVYRHDIKAVSFKTPIVISVDKDKNAVKETPILNYCQDNNQAKKIITVIDTQTLYACSYNELAYKSLVTTGYTQYPNDITPLGTYTIFSKQTNLDLTGNDGHTSWNDPVKYWMEFLSNQYGQYGLHDASWLPANLFGHVNINTNYNQSSKGCIELPNATAKWLYNWTQIGTQVEIVQSNNSL